MSYTLKREREREIEKEREKERQREMCQHTAQNEHFHLDHIQKHTHSHTTRGMRDLLKQSTASSDWREMPARMCEQTHTYRRRQTDTHNKSPAFRISTILLPTLWRRRAGWDSVSEVRKSTSKSGCQRHQQEDSSLAAQSRKDNPSLTLPSPIYYIHKKHAWSAWGLRGLR